MSLAHTVPFKEEAPDSRVGLCVQTNTDSSISGPFVECSSALILKAEPALRRVSSCPLFPWMEVMDFAESGGIRHFGSICLLSISSVSDVTLFGVSEFHLISHRESLGGWLRGAGDSVFHLF